MRLRKNIECLTTEQLHDLREAFEGIFLLPESNPSSFFRIAGLHGLPAPSYCNHSGTSGFLSWHRAYLLELENALREIRCNVTLPYWDWDSTSAHGIPEACKNPTYVNRVGSTVNNPLYRGPIAPSAGGGFTTRRSDINTISFADLAISANANQSEANFNNYAGNLNGYHGSVHVRCQGSMGSVARAAFDPIFYLHHANVDRLWAAWQATTSGAMPNSELNTELRPFTKPYTDIWHIGADFENISVWNYNYRYWCYFFPPIFWPREQLIKLPFEPWMLGSKRTNLILRSDTMSMQSVELRVFINEPEADSKTSTIDNPNYAGSIGIFGMGEAHGLSIYGNKPQTHKLNITKRLKESVEKNGKELSINLVPVSKEGKKFKFKNAKVFNVEIEAI